MTNKFDAQKTVPELVTDGNGLKIIGLGHINIVVDEINEATEFYKKLFGAVPFQEFPHFKNRGFALSAGFLEDPESVEASIRFLKIPGCPLVLELMEYHNPAGSKTELPKSVADQGGVRHVALSIEGIDEAFQFVKQICGVNLINSSKNYFPHNIDNIYPDEFHFFDRDLEADSEAKEEVCSMVGTIRYFYFTDRYGVQWELEQGHNDTSKRP